MYLKWGLNSFLDCASLFFGLASGPNEVWRFTAGTAIGCSCGCGASVNRYSRYARSSERRQMGLKFSLWRIQITVKLSLRRCSRRKN